MGERETSTPELLKSTETVFSTPLEKRALLRALHSQLPENTKEEIGAVIFFNSTPNERNLVAFHHEFFGRIADRVTSIARGNHDQRRVLKFLNQEFLNQEHAEGRKYTSEDLLALGFAEDVSPELLKQWSEGRIAKKVRFGHIEIKDEEITNKAKFYVNKDYRKIQEDALGEWTKSEAILDYGEGKIVFKKAESQIALAKTLIEFLVYSRAREKRDIRAYGSADDLTEINEVLKQKVEKIVQEYGEFSLFHHENFKSTLKNIGVSEGVVSQLMPAQ